MIAKNKIKNILQNNYYYRGVECNYEIERNCYLLGCNEEGICRCGIIYEAKITKTDPNYLLTCIQDEIEKNFQGKQNPMKNPINTYAIGRLIIHHKMDKEYNYDIHIIKGYYGEEIDKITNLNHDNFIKDLIHVLSLNSNTSKIEFLLTLEYGYVPEHLKNLNWETKNIPIQQITYLEQQFEKATEDNNQTRYPLNPDEQSIICIEQGNHYQLVDGYHRLQYKIATKKELTKAICGSRKKLK
jgi:hypothetical protein